MKTLTFFLGVSLLAGSPVARGQAAPPDLAAILKAMNLGADAKQQVLQGEIVSRDLAEGSPKELAAVLALRIRAPLAKLLEAARTGKTLEIERDILGFGPADTGLDKLGYTADEADEALAVLNAAPGGKFNFSSAEIERWKLLKAKLKGADPRKNPTALEAVNAEYRAILADRLAAYQKGGLKAIAPYTRGKKEASPAEELALACREATALGAFPEFKQAIDGYPASGQDQVEERYLWFKQRIENRPVMILAHRMYRTGPDYVVAMERQIYVGASYNSQQSITGGREEEGAVIGLYSNRCFTDQVAGMMSSMKHGIGRGQMIEELKAHFERVRQMLEQ